jgi:hypothetical protein
LRDADAVGEVIGHAERHVAELYAVVTPAPRRADGEEEECSSP